MAGPRNAAPPLVEEHLSDVRDLLSEASGLLICLDYDGTLAPIVDNPADAEIDDDVRRELRRLQAHPNVKVAIVSGRALDDLRERVGVEGLYYAGNHGIELADDTERYVDENARKRKPALDRAVAALRAELDDVPGVEVEDKQLTATVHYRRTPRERVAEVEETVAEVVAAVDELRLSQGKQILEVRPDVDADKGRAVDRLVDLHPDYFPLYVGDDVTDEDAFRALPPEGLAVLVGDRSDTAASLRVTGPDGVVRLLRLLADGRVDTDDDLS